MRFLFLLFSFPYLLWAGDPLTYTITPGTWQGKPCLHVRVEFDGTKDGISYLNYQDNQFGETGQMAFLELTAPARMTQVSKEPDSNRIVVKHPKGARVQLQYIIRDLEGDSLPFYKYCCNNPIIKSKYYHVQSGHLLAVPKHYWEGPDDVKVVQFRWEGIPAGWTIHNSFGPDYRQRVELTNSQLGYAVFVGGDFRQHCFEVKGQPVYFVTRGKWSKFSDDSLIDLLKRTVEGHREFWNDYGDSTYSITFLPINDAPWSKTEHHISLGGSGLTNSFLSYATDNPGIEFDQVRYIYVHELMHRWIGIKIENAKEEQQYWFSEGFTEYFTLKNSLRYGFITADQFVKSLNNDFASQHYASNVRTMPNDSLNYDKFWNGGKEWEKLPYRRGCLYAFYLDNYIREHSKGEKNLDQLMRAILAETSRNPAQKLDHEFFLKMLKPFCGKEGAADFKRFIENGELIDFVKTTLPAGLHVIVKDVTMQYGASPNQIDRTEVLKNIPVFQRNEGVEDAALKAALLK